MIIHSTTICDIKQENDIYIILVKHSVDLDGGGIRELLEKLESISENKKYKILFDATDLEMGHVNRSAYEENISVKLAKNRVAEAFVTNSLPVRMIINFYHRVIQPPFPSKLFKTMDDAKKWLNSL